MSSPSKRAPKRTREKDDVVEITEGTTTATSTAKKSVHPFFTKKAGESPTETAPTPEAIDLKEHLKEPGWIAAINGAKLWESKGFIGASKQVNADVAAGKTVLPSPPLVFDALNACPFDKIKIVLVGQDPYPTPGNAHGLCFSVVPTVKAIPGSLRNIYKELTSDIDGFTAPTHGYLRAWAERGVLMLNATLTVLAGQANSHAKTGWQEFTDNLIRLVDEKCEGVVFMLWGGFAQKKEKMINKKKHGVVTSAHPSPLSVNSWTGCKVFSRCQAELKRLGKEPMDWTLPATAQLNITAQ